MGASLSSLHPGAIPSKSRKCFRMEKRKKKILEWIDRKMLVSAKSPTPWRQDFSHFLIVLVVEANLHSPFARIHDQTFLQLAWHVEEKEPFREARSEDNTRVHADGVKCGFEIVTVTEFEFDYYRHLYDSDVDHFSCWIHLCCQKGRLDFQREHSSSLDPAVPLCATFAALYAFPSLVIRVQVVRRYPQTKPQRKKATRKTRKNESEIDDSLICPHPFSRFFDRHDYFGWTAK